MPASSPTGVEMKAIVAKGLSTPYGTEDLREALGRAGGREDHAARAGAAGLCHRVVYS